MSRQQRSDRSLAKQAEKGKVSGKRIGNNQDVGNVRVSQAQAYRNTLMKLGMLDRINEVAQSDEDASLLTAYMNGLAETIMTSTLPFSKKYLMEALIKLISSNDISVMIEYVNEIGLPTALLLQQSREYLGDHYTEDAANYILSRYDHFDITTYNGRTALIEFVDYYLQNPEAAISDQDVDFENHSPSEDLKSIKSQIDDDRSASKEIVGVKDLGYCTDCGSKLLLVDEIQDRSGDEGKSVYISCAQCGKRGPNIKFYSDDNE